MSNPLFVATAHGLMIYAQQGADWREIAQTLTQHNVTSVIAREGVILAGTTTGVYRSDDVGKNWQPASTGLTHRHVRWLAYDPTLSDAVLDRLIHNAYRLELEGESMRKVHSLLHTDHI